MNLFRKLFGGSTKKRLLQKHPDAIESRLIVEDPALYRTLRDANHQQQRRTAAAAARHAVASTNLQHPLLAQAFSCLETGELPSPALVSAFQQLANDLDIEDCQSDEDECSGETPSENVPVTFYQARAATCVVNALSGRVDEAVYEAIHATEDLPKVREIVLSTLAGNDTT